MNEDNRKRDAMINDILCEFEFDKVQAIMVLMDVKWRGLNDKDERHTPSVDELIAVSREILTEAYDQCRADHEFIGCGKLDMYAEAFIDGQLELTYQPFSILNCECGYNEDGSHNENY